MIANEIQRLNKAKEDIKNSIENKGVSVPSDASISDYSTYIDNIQGGGGVSGADNIVNPQFDEWGLLKGDVVFKDSVTNLEKSYYFYNNNNLRSVKGDGVKTFIGENMFANCFYMNSVDFPNCDKATFGNDCFSNFDLISDGGGVINFPNVKDLTVKSYSLSNVKATLNIPSDFERLSLSQYAFGNSNFNFIERINFSSLKKVKFETNWWYTNAQIDWPEKIEFDSLEEIEDGSYSFVPYNIHSLKAFVFGENLKHLGGYSIGKEDFSVYFKGKTPPTISPGYESFLFDKRDNFFIYVPCDAVDDYKEAWSNYADIIKGYNYESPSINCRGEASRDDDEK